VFLKLELFQYTGTFKPRGALSNMLALSSEELERGVTAVSAGNHAIAVSYAARVLGTHAKVVMPRHANQMRVKKCEGFGAEIVSVDDVHDAFEAVRQVEKSERRAFIHPYEGLRTILGTATVGLELMAQVDQLELTEESARPLDAVIVPIGGGGLCAGIATAVKLIQPTCEVFGVEPVGADSMHRSFASGRPEALDRLDTIADSLGAPHVEPYSLSLCQRYVDEIVLIEDAAMKRAMRLLFDEMKLAVEPAGAAATAGLMGPLRERLAGKKVGVVVCGSNIDIATFNRLIDTSG
jgi:threonine dehydratase